MPTITFKTHTDANTPDKVQAALKDLSTELYWFLLSLDSINIRSINVGTGQGATVIESDSGNLVITPDSITVDKVITPEIEYNGNITLDTTGNAAYIDIISVGTKIATIADLPIIPTGATGSFQSGDAVPKTVTVVNGIITSIV